MRVKYNKATGLIEGCFPLQLHYPSNLFDTKTKTIDGSPYIEITVEEHLSIIGQKVKVENGVIKELTEEENQAQIKIINDDIFNKMSYAEKRKKEYGSDSKQIENIIEYGLEYEQKRVQAIKQKYPKV